MKVTETNKNYRWGPVDVTAIGDSNLYTYNVQKRFLHFFWRTVFSVEGFVASKCRDACRKYIEENGKD